MRHSVPAVTAGITRRAAIAFSRSALDVYRASRKEEPSNYQSIHTNISVSRKCRPCDYTPTVETESRWGPGSGRADCVVPGLIVDRECCGPDLSFCGRAELLLALNEIATGTTEAAMHFSSLVQHILRESKVKPSNLVRDYLSTVHRWLPVFSEEQLTAATESCSLHSTPVITVALLAIVLIMRVPCGPGIHSMESNNLYFATRSSFTALQQAGILDSELVAVGLLLTAYECGHGMRANAYLTLASCLAMARLKGLDKTGDDTLSGDTSRSPIWSAIMILDR